MTNDEVAIAIAPFVRDGLVANSDNPAGYWLELMVTMAGFCAASIGEGASQQVIRQLAVECGSTVQ